MKLHTNEASDQEYTVVSDTAERKVAKSLTDEQAAWLQECPVILKVGVITDMGEVAVVHGGLRQQRRYSVVQTQEEVDTSVPPKTMTVIYGHDAAKSLNIRQYTKGLDSGCVYGRKLSALVIEDGGKSEVVQVKCDEYVKS
ncbi:hypothetical protein EIK77_002586 [Talaromyces pinophilus]|nr:hypothetical protein EIK77_002586 [Talaromyces pinophilus]